MIFYSILQCVIVSFILGVSFSNYTRPGEMFSFIPKYTNKLFEKIYNTLDPCGKVIKKSVYFGFVEKITSCDQCQAGWFCLLYSQLGKDFSFSFLESFFLVFLTMFLVKLLNK